MGHYKLRGFLKEVWSNARCKVHYITLEKYLKFVRKGH